MAKAAPRLPPAMHVVERDWLSSNNIVFIGADQCAVVDTGYPTHAPMTVALIQHLLQGRPLDRIVCTHLHADHCGGNAALLQRYPNAQIEVAASSLAAVARWDQTVLDHDAFNQPCDRFSASAGIDVGEHLRLGDLDWQAIGSPGHDADSLMLYNAAHRILISADALWANGFGVLFGELRGGSAFAEQRATLAVIDALDVAIVVPGHGPLFTDIKAALRRAHSRLDYLQADSVRQARITVKVMIKFMLLERQRLRMDELGPLLQRTPLLAEIHRRFFDEPVEQLAAGCAAELVNSGAARRDAHWLVN